MQIRSRLIDKKIVRRKANRRLYIDEMSIIIILLSKGHQKGTESNGVYSFTSTEIYKLCRESVL